MNDSVQFQLASTKHDHPSISIGTLKFVLLCSILVMGLGSVFAPRRLTGKPAIFSLGNMMASGVLLSAGLVHQLADSAQTLNKPDSFPWAMFIAGLTFLLFMVAEESLHLVLGADNNNSNSHSNTNSNHSKNDDSNNHLNDPLKLHHALHGGISMDEKHSHTHTHANSNDRDDSNVHVPSIHTSVKSQQDAIYNHHHSNDAIPSSSEQQPLFQNIPFYTADACCSRMTISCSSGINGDTLNQSHHGPGNRRPSQFGSFLQSTKTHKEDPFMLTEHHHHDDHIEMHLHGSILASGILMLALSIHSILAGISIGIETQPESITGTAIAILAHKSFEGFCLGSSLVTAQLDHFPFLVLGISFSCATPLGIILGQILADHVSTGGTMIAVVQAIVAGTFLYIAIVEIGGKELLVCRQEMVDVNGGPQRQRQIEAAKLVCFVAGYLAMSALALAV